MLTRLIQSLFFISICATMQGMQTKKNSPNNCAITNPAPNKQKLNNNRSYQRLNYNKQHYTENKQYAPTPEINQIYYPPVMETGPIYYDPVMEISPLCYYPPVMESNPIYDAPAPIIIPFDLWKSMWNKPHEAGVLRPETEKLYNFLMQESLKEDIAPNNINPQELTTAQMLNRARLLDKCTPLFNSPEFLLKTQKEETSYAYELLDFTNALHNKNKSIQTPEKLTKAINALIKKVADPVAYILTTCQYLHAINSYEKQKVLNNLMQQNNPATLSALAENPLSSIIIEQLKHAPLTGSNSYLSDLNLAIAELEYYRGNTKEAHTYYSQITPSYTQEKINSYPFGINAFKACLASTDNFYYKVRHYLKTLTPDIHNTILAIEKTDPKISHGIGLLAQERIHNSPGMDTEKKIAVLENAIEHLEYAQKSMPSNKITALLAEFHTALSPLYAVKNDGAESLKQMHNALTCSAQTNNSTQTKELLAMIAHNPELCTQHTQWVSKILNLIYNPCRQQYNNLHKDYALLAPFAKSILGQQLLPYLSDAYTTNKQNKNEIAHILALLHQHNGDYSKACLYLNFMAHIDEPLMHHCIHTIALQKNRSQIIQEIAPKAICPKMIEALHAIATTDNNPLLPYRNILLAELNYYANKFEQALAHYAEIPKKELSAAAKAHIFNAYIATTETFGKKEIDYLSSLFKNIFNQLKTIETTSSTLSYKVGLITHYLLHNNAKLSIAEQTEIMLYGLKHLEYAQKNGTVKYDTTINHEFHTLLSTLYESQNNIVASLNHTRCALEYQSRNDNNKYNSLLTALVTAEKQNPEFYIQHAGLIQLIVHYIQDQPYAPKQKMYDLLDTFAASDLFMQILPYCEQTYSTSKQTGHEIICLMALAHKNHGDLNKACELIDALPHPIPTAALWLKMGIYAAAQKTASDTELETIFRLHTNNKKPSAPEQETILSLITASYDFFIRTKNYTLATKIIAKLSELPSLSPTTLQLAYHVTKYLKETSNPLLKQCLQEIDSSQLYNKIKDQSAYEKAINLLLPEKNAEINALCCQLYCDWADSIKLSNKEKCLGLLDLAITTHNSSLARYKKALFILSNAQDIRLINHAIELLEENITTNSPEKIVSTLELVRTYLNIPLKPERAPILQKLVPFNIAKAMSYLEAHDNNKDLLKILRNIRAGIGETYQQIATKENLIDLKQALELTELIINLYGSTAYELVQRMDIHIKLSQYDKALEDIELILNTPDITYNTDIKRKQLLIAKAQCLFESTLDDTVCDQILECHKQIELYDEEIRTFTFYSSKKAQKRTRHIVTEKIMTPSAIQWCCLSARLEVIDGHQNSHKNYTTPEQKELILYLIEAAKAGHAQAQLIVMAYANTIKYRLDDIDLFIELLEYAHAALFNPTITHTKKAFWILALLNSFASKGCALSHYILCDYHQNDTKQLEAILISFSKVKDPSYYLDRKDTKFIEKICASCRNVLRLYVERYLKNREKCSLIDALGTYTLGSLYHYADKKDLLSAATVYLNQVIESFNKKFKLPHVAASAQILLAHTYYNHASLVETTMEKLNLYRKGAELGFIVSVQKIAEMWIQQHKDGNNDLDIKTDEFVPLLEHYIKNSSSGNLRSAELYEQYLAIKNQKRNVKELPSDRAVSTLRNEISKACEAVLSNEKEKEIVVVNALNEEKNSNESDEHAVAKIQELPSPCERITIIKTYPQLIKHITYQEKSPAFYAGFFAGEREDTKEMITQYQKAVTKESNSNAAIELALHSLGEADTIKNPAHAEKLLTQALTYCLVLKSRNGKTKQFHNMFSLDKFLIYMNTLITEPKLKPIKQPFLSKIKTAFVREGVEMSPLTELYEKLTGTKLELVKEWKTAEEISKTPSPKKADPFQNELYRALNSTEKAILANQKKIQQPTIGELIESIVNYPDYRPCDQTFIDGSEAYERGNMELGFKLMSLAAKEHNHPGALIYLAVDTLIGANTNEQYNSVKDFLTEALFYGLKENRFYNAHTLSIYCSFIKLLFTGEHSPLIKQELFSIIKTKLKAHEVNIATFWAIVLYETKLDSQELTKWLTDEEEKEQKPTISDLKKNMIAYKETCHNFIDGQRMYKQGKIQPALVLMSKAIIQDRHPIACLEMLKHKLSHVVTKNTYTESQDLLEQAFEYSLEKNELKTEPFLNAVADCIKIFLSKQHPPFIKQRFFITIKNGLKQANISDADFCAMVLEKTKIDLSLDLHWKIKIIYSSGNPLEDMQRLETINNSETTEPKINYTQAPVIVSTDNLPGDTRIMDVLRSAETEQTITINPDEAMIAMLEKSLIRDANYVETCLSFKSALQAYEQGQPVIALGLVKHAADKQSHPIALMSLALDYLVTQDYSQSKDYLSKGLSHGVQAGKFCNETTLQYAWDYLTELLRTKHESAIKKSLLLELFAMLEAKNVNRADFLKLFQKKRDIDLSSFIELKK